MTFTYQPVKVKQGFLANAHFLRMKVWKHGLITCSSTLAQFGGCFMSFMGQWIRQWGSSSLKMRQLNQVLEKSMTTSFPWKGSTRIHQDPFGQIFLSPGKKQHRVCFLQLAGNLTFLQRFTWDLKQIVRKICCTYGIGWTILVFRFRMLAIPSSHPFPGEAEGRCGSTGSVLCDSCGMRVGSVKF